MELQINRRSGMLAERLQMVRREIPAQGVATIDRRERCGLPDPSGVNGAVASLPKQRSYL